MGSSKDRVVHSLVYGGTDRAVVIIGYPEHRDGDSYYYDARVEHDHRGAGGGDGDIRLYGDGYIAGIEGIAPDGMEDRLRCALLEVMQEYGFLSVPGLAAYREMRERLGNPNMHA